MQTLKVRNLSNSTYRFNSVGTQRDFECTAGLHLGCRRAPGVRGFLRTNFECEENDFKLSA